MWQCGRSSLFERLGTLSRIQYFNLGETKECPFVFGREYDLKFGLKNGLARLKERRQLRTLDSSRTSQELTEVDVQWMGEHWPRLTTIEGKLNPLLKKTTPVAILQKTFALKLTRMSLFK